MKFGNTYLASIRAAAQSGIGSAVILLSVAQALAGGAGEEGVWTLPKALAYVQSESPDAKIGAERQRAAEATLREAEAKALPQLSGQAGYVRTNQPAAVFGMALNQESFSPALDFNDVPDADQASAGVRVAVPLYAGGAIQGARAAATAGARAAESELRAIEQRLGLEVARTFYAAQKAASLQRAAEAAADSFAANLRVAQDREKAGAGLRTESLDLEVRLAEAREQITQAKHARALAALALAQLLGIDGRVALDPDCACPAEPPAESEAQRPEIAAAADRSEAARHAARAAKAASRPQVEAFAAAEGVAGSEFGGSGANYTAGIALRWNLWDGGAAKAARQRADAEASAAAEMHRKARLGVQREIAAAELNAAEAAERLAVSAKAVTLAEESANLTRSQFEQGAATASQVVDAETALTAARVRHAQADADRRLAIATWRYALGLPLLGK